jgi:hypothetical protein
MWPVEKIRFLIVTFLIESGEKRFGNWSDMGDPRIGLSDGCTSIAKPEVARHALVRRPGLG